MNCFIKINILSATSLACCCNHSHIVFPKISWQPLIGLAQICQHLCMYYYSVKNSCSFKNFFRSGRRSRLIGYYIFSSFFLLSWLLSNSPCPQMHQFRLCLLSSKNTMMPITTLFLTAFDYIKRILGPNFLVKYKYCL